MVLHLVFVLFAVQVFSEQGEEEAQPENDSFGGLKLEVLFDPEVSNEGIHTLVSQGLKHDNPKIVESTVGAIIFYVNLNRIQVEEKRLLPEFDRRLQDVPDLYDKLIAMWDTNWEEVDGVIPDLVFSINERSGTDVGSVLPRPYWLGLPLTLAYLYPQDEKVYEIIWDVFSSEYRGGLPDGQRVTYTEDEIRAEGGSDTNNPLPLLSALFHGKFNNPKDREFRIEILSHIGSVRQFSSLAARSLGEFRSDEGFEALVTVLEKDQLMFGTPKIQIVEAMLKYGEKAVPYIPLMRTSLESSKGFDAQERALKTKLEEQLGEFEKELGKEKVDEI
ncbi:MAG: hypothetical protein F4227_02655 [Gammaproteobacteria bacterium]|nr:hypothetical protein [Gammaproteobacteria bacterium]